MRPLEHRIRQAARGAVYYVLQLCESGACVVYPSRQIVLLAIERHAEASRILHSTTRPRDRPNVWDRIIREAYAAVAHRQMKVEQEISMALRVLERNEDPCAQTFTELLRQQLSGELAADVDAAEIRLRILDDMRHTLGGMLLQTVTTSRQRRRQRYNARPLTLEDT